MKNKLYDDFTKEKFNKDENYNAIISKVKEEKTMKENKKYKKYKKVLNIAAIFIVAIVIVGVAPAIYAKIQWDIKFKEYQNREYETGSVTIKDAVESGYNEEIDMEYITLDGISAKVDSLMITDDYFETNINFKFEDYIKLNSESFSFGYAVYDEENNIYGIFTRMHLGSNEKSDTYTPYIYKEIGVKYNKHDIYAIQFNDTTGVENVSAEGRNIISKIKMGSNKGFPKSKKLYIRIFDLGYSMTDYDKENNKDQAEDFPISKAEWIFEINVPEKFYDRQTTELKLKDNIPGLELEKITVTEVGLVLKAKIDGFSDIVKFGKDISIEEWKKMRNETVNITDEDGNIYYENTMGTLRGKDWFKINFEINKNMLNKRYFLNVRINGQQYSSELIK